jgi:HPt (histidine-containing phosphotransfer) domain-containing protein
MNGPVNSELERASPIDLDHLRRQTLGRAELAREVLVLFDEHAANQVTIARRAPTSAGKREAAHSLIGAAKGVGAFAVAQAATAVERGRDPLRGMAALDAAVQEARAFIGAYLVR